MVKEMKTNLPAYRQGAGAAPRPFDNAAPASTARRRACTAHAERAAVEAWSFDEQFHSFQARFAQARARERYGGQVLGQCEAPETKAARRTEDIGDEDEHGVWGPKPT